MVIIWILAALVILCEAGRYDLQAVGSGQALPGATLQLCALALGLGVLVMRRPPAAGVWNAVGASILAAAIAFVACWGHDVLDGLGGRPAQIWADSHQTVLGSGFAFALGLCSQYRWRMRQRTEHTKQRPGKPAVTRPAAHAARLPTAEAPVPTSAAASLLIAEQLWGAPRNPGSGSVPEVTPDASKLEADQNPGPDTGLQGSKRWPEREVIDSRWTLWSGERVLADNLAVDVALTYEGLDRVNLDRVVTVRALIGKGHQDHSVTITKIGGYCHLRGADREFRLESVVAAFDPQTGEVIGAPGSWLMRQSGRSEHVRPIETRTSAWRAVEPTMAEVEIDLSRGRGQAVETFTVEIRSVFGPGVAFEGLAERLKTALVSGWKGQKRFAVAPEGTVHFKRLTASGELVEDVPSWLASLPDASVSTRTPPPGRINAKPL